MPFLTQNYHNIYAVDYRTYWKMSMERFVEKYKVDEVIISPSMIATQAIDGAGFFEDQFR